MRLFKLLILLYLDIFIFLFIFTINSYRDITVSDYSWIALFISIYILVTMLPLKKGDGLFFAFTTIYCVVIFGRGILYYGIGYTPNSSFFDSFKMFSNETMENALLLGVYCLIGLHIGFLISKFTNKTVITDSYPNSSINNYKILAIKKTGWVILLIALIPSLINYYNQFRTLNSNTLNQDIDTLIGMLVGLMFPFFVILIITQRKHWPYILSLIYYFPQLFWGGRGRPIIIISILTFLYFKFVTNGKVSLAKKVIFIFGGILVLNLFVVIKEMRRIPLNEWILEFPYKFFSTLINSNPILEVIYEIGVALAPTAAVLDYVPDEIPVQYGLTIIYSIFTAIPDVLGIRPDIMNLYGNVPGLIGEYAGASFGGAILQDFYINFLWLSPVVMVLTGFLLQKLSYKISYEQNIINIVFYSMILFPILWWPRSSFGFMFRTIVVTSILPFIIYIFFKHYLLKRYGVKNE